MSVAFIADSGLGYCSMLLVAFSFSKKKKEMICVIWMTFVQDIKKACTNCHQVIKFMVFNAEMNSECYGYKGT